jgi:NitT/TauT family transport system permease protein
LIILWGFYLWEAAMAISESTRMRSVLTIRSPFGEIRLRRNQARWLRVAVITLTFAALIAGWQLLVRYRNYPAFILPGPDLVWAELLRSIQTVSFWQNIGVTLIEVLGGLAIGAALAFILGYVIAKSPVLNSILSPLIVASQAVPIVAVAPLLAIWFGYGLTPKIVTSVLIVFFPILINVVSGLRSVEPNLRDLMRSLQANRRQLFLKLEIPAALPMVLSGLKVGATLAVIGAIVGEFVNSDQGLGFLIKQGNGEYNTARTFVALIALVVMALLMYGGVALLEHRWLAWKK